MMKAHTTHKAVWFCIASVVIRAARGPGAMTFHTTPRRGPVSSTCSPRTRGYPAPHLLANIAAEAVAAFVP